VSEKIRLLLRGAGSIIDIYPNLSNQPVEERIADHWRRAGDHLYWALDAYHDAEITHREETRDKDRPSRNRTSRTRA